MKPNYPNGFIVSVCTEHKFVPAALAVTFRYKVGSDEASATIYVPAEDAALWLVGQRVVINT